MNALDSRMSSMFDMIAVLEDQSNPPPMDRYSLSFGLIAYIWNMLLLYILTPLSTVKFDLGDPIRMVTDIRRIVAKLEENYKVLATYMTEIKMDELDKKPADPKLRAFLFFLYVMSCIFQAYRFGMLDQQKTLKF